MKTIQQQVLIMLMLALSISACQQDKRYSQSSQEIDLFKQSLKDYVNQDWEALAAHYADTAKIMHNTTLKNAKTVAQLIEKEKANAEILTDIKYLDAESDFEMVVTDKGETWVNFWGVWQATLKENNQTYEVPLHITARYIDGKIVAEYGYWDNSDAAEAAANLMVVDLMYKNFSAGEVPAVLAAMDANVVWNEAEGNPYADNNPYMGPEAVLNGVFGRVMADHDYFNLQDISLHSMHNGKVLATLRYDAKNKTTGKTYNAQAAHLWTLKDGKVIAFQQYVDTAKLIDAIKAN